MEGIPQSTNVVYKNRQKRRRIPLENYFNASHVYGNPERYLDIQQYSPKTMTKVIFTVLILALGMIPLELALRLS